MFARVSFNPRLPLVACTIVLAALAFRPPFQAAATLGWTKAHAVAVGKKLAGAWSDAFVAAPASPPAEMITARNASAQATDVARQTGQLLSAAKPETTSATENNGRSPAAPSIKVQPAALEFASQNLLTSSGAQQVVVSNAGGATLAFGRIRKIGIHADDFHVTDTCGGMLPAGKESCTITVTFSPGAGGRREAKLIISTNDAANRVVEIMLGGDGVTPIPVTLQVSMGGTWGGAVTSSPSGILCGGACSGQFPAGTKVALIAIPDSRSVLDHWSGCDDVTPDRKCLMSMSSSSSAKAIFRPSGGPATDLNGDGHPDIVWANTTNGATNIWYMSGPAMISEDFVAQVDPAWEIQGTADFNDDGYPDVVWRNALTGETWITFMNAGKLVDETYLFTLPPQWVIEGIADFNADGYADLLMRNVDPSSGLAFVWFFHNATPIAEQQIFTIDPSWKVEQVYDFNGDGQPDLLFRSLKSGLSFAWFTQLVGSRVSLAGSTQPFHTLDLSWEVVQVADWNGDGQPDLLFRNANTGTTFVWYMDGMKLGKSDFVTQIDPTWEIAPRR